MRPGAVVGGKYRLTRFLGEGAMGSVWAAVHVQTGQSSAVKLISGPAVMATELRARLLREAKACSSIEHPNVVAVHDVGQLDDGAPFLVMQLLTGETLEARLSREGPLVPYEAARIGGQVARALSAAHAASIIHRDLKPANIFLHVERPGGQPTVKVLDFGVSKILSETAGTAPEMRATATGHAVGSPAYMSPEQAKSANKVDARSDVWALGVVLFEMLAGELPFPGETAYAVVGEILHGPIRTLQEVAPDVDERLSTLIGRCIVRDLKARIQTADAVAAELEGFARERGRSATAAAASSGDETTEPLGHNRLRAAVLGGKSGLRLGALDLDGPTETQPPSSSAMQTERPPPPPAPPPPPPTALRPAPTVPSHHLPPTMRPAPSAPAPHVAVVQPAPLVQARPAGQLGPAVQPTMVMQQGPQTAPQVPAPRPSSPNSQPSPNSHALPLPPSARTVVISPGPQSGHAMQYAPTAVMPSMPAESARPASPVTLPVPLLNRKSGAGTSTGPHLIQSPSSLDPAAQALADFNRRRTIGIVAGIGALALVAMIALAVALSGGSSPPEPAHDDPGTPTTTTGAAAGESPSSAPAATAKGSPSAASPDLTATLPSTPEPGTVADTEPAVTAVPEPPASTQPSAKPSGRGRVPKPPSTSLFPSNPG